jgi:hypothetical protein
MDERRAPVTGAPLGPTDVDVLPLASVSTDLITCAEIVVAVMAIVAVGVTARSESRRRLDGRRDHWRSQDRLEGWVDSRNRWHPGVVDAVQGWEDDDGVHHEGVTEQLVDLRTDFDRHVEDGHGGG